ncbi:tetratricopeptide repeat protein [Acidimangrovimonas pyrenivorans]|uniref:Tetratricopeptide repeat protein n=1 Tax=Acidimangrovimonas pyrenivorans TaxID=2030798 RepID=A0ABV7AIC4_9RHOB
MKLVATALCAPLLSLLALGAPVRADPVKDCLSAAPLAEPQAALETCTVAAARDMPDASRAQVLLNIGLAQRALDRLPQSESALRRAATLAPRDAEILRMLAWTLRQERKPAQAEMLLTRSLKLADVPQGWLSRCVVRQDQAHFSQAVPDCARALEERPGDLDAIYFSARALNRSGQPGDALAVAREGLTENAESGRIYVQAARAQLSLGRAAAARDTIAEGLRLFPGDAGLARLRTSLH